VADAEPVALLDAVCCVHFCAAGKHGLLLSLLTAMNWKICVPGEVSNEVLGKARKYPTLATPWKKFIAHDRVHVLDVIDLDRDDQAAVREKVAELRGTTAALALSQRADLGEHIVVAQGVVLREEGRQVFVLIDDQAGQELAAGQELDLIDVEQLLLLGHMLRLPELDTHAKVKAVYNQLVPYGLSLVSWPQSRLPAELAKLQRPSP
jgi:hypothetical protein